MRRRTIVIKPNNTDGCWDMHFPDATIHTGTNELREWLSQYVSFFSPDIHEIVIFTNEDHGIPEPRDIINPEKKT